MTQHNQSVTLVRKFISESGDKFSHGLSLEWLPQNGTVEDGEMRLTRPWPHSARRDVVDIHDADNVIFSIAAALEICVQLIFQPLIHIFAKKGRMDADFSFQIA